MKNFLTRFLVFLCVASSFSTAKADEEIINNSMKDLTLVVGSGIAGAICEPGSAIIRRERHARTWLAGHRAEQCPARIDLVISRSTAGIS